MLPLLREAMTLIENNIEEPLTVPQIAKILGISQRQLERQFKKNVGCTVVQFSLLKRLQNARLLLISTDMSIRQIATASGFNTMSHFAFSFGKFFEDDLQIIGRLGQRRTCTQLAGFSYRFS